VPSITVNGKPVEAAATDLSALLLELGIRGERMAVERNLELVPRRLWPQTRIEAGDRIEIVHLVGGGSRAL
jgi:sulfur carrier protein